MPKVYPTPTGTQKSDTERKETGVKKTFGIYDKPVRTSPAMIAAVVIAAIVVFVVIMMLMRQ